MDDLYALPFLCDAVKRLNLPELIVVSPDAGFAKKARQYASKLGTSLAICDKERSAHDENAEVLEIIGDVRGKTALLVDDLMLSGGTLVDAAGKLLEEGALAVYAAVTHAAVSERSIKKLSASAIRRIFVTDSIETQPVALTERFEVVSVAPLLGEAIRRIHHHESISVLFQD